MASVDFLLAQARRASDAVLCAELSEFVKNYCFMAGEDISSFAVVTVRFHTSSNARVHMNAATYARVAIASCGVPTLDKLRRVFISKQHRDADRVLRTYPFMGNWHEDPSLADFEIVVPATWGPAEEFVWQLVRPVRTGLYLGLRSIVVTPHPVFAQSGHLQHTAKAMLEGMLEAKYALTGRAINVGDVVYADGRGACVILALYGIFRTNCAMYYWNGLAQADVDCYVADDIAEWDALVAEKVARITLPPPWQHLAPACSVLTVTDLDKVVCQEDNYIPIVNYIADRARQLKPAGTELLRRGAAESAKKGGRGRRKRSASRRRRRSHVRRK